MDFYSSLASRGLSGLLRRVDYTPPVYSVAEDVYHWYDEAINQDASIAIYGDYDVDGLMCILSQARAFDLLGYDNYSILHYRQRTHALDPVAAYKCVQQGYEYLIVCDTGSSIPDKKVLRYLVEHGVKVLILDHHQTTYSYSDYEPEITILNTTIENRSREENDKLCLSAGALCYTVLREYLLRNGVADDSIAAYATISLFSDCMDMKSELNRSIYFNAMHLLNNEIPRDALFFMNQYSKFNSRYINYWFSPRINAMFRSENLELLNMLFFNRNLDLQSEQALIDRIESVYVSIRSMINEVTDILMNDVVQLEHFVVADLCVVDKHVPVVENKLYNYTGLVANKLSDRFSKTAVVYCLNNNEYKGSVRDLFGRNYLPLFQAFCDAGGHGAAFGLHVRPFGFNSFVDSLHTLNDQFALQNISNIPIVVEYTYNYPDAVLIEDMALYNEFAGQSVPVALLQKQIVGAISEHHTKYGYRYSWGEYTIQSEHAIEFGRSVLMKPFKSGKTKLLVQ